MTSGRAIRRIVPLGLLGALCVSGLARPALATNVGVVPKKLIVVDKLVAATKAKAVFVAKDAAVTKGPGTDVEQISVQFDVAYGNGSAAGAFTLPAGASVNKSPGWVVNKDTVAKYVNKEAPDGPTGGKVAVIKPGKLLKLVGKSLGDTPLDILGAGDPGVGGVETAYCVTNGGEEHCHCSAFTSCAWKEIAGGTGAKLVCKRGTGDPACSAVVPSTTTSTSSSTTTSTICDHATWEGSYSGTYTGDENGTWTGTVDNAGAMTVEALSPSCGVFSGSGSVSACGGFSAVTNGSGACSAFFITWDGAFVAGGGGVSGSGSWVSSSGFSGSWTGGRIAP
jgi:hypothetical protein